MNHPSLTAAVAAERTRDLRGAATHSRLAALAQCCKPSSWRAALRNLAARIAAAREAREPRAVACVAC
jgi:hypothetical protein